MSRQHPKAGEIRALLDEGLNNRIIAQRLRLNQGTVARVRADAGLPPTPRSAWTRRPHPKADQIRALLGEGLPDAEIRRQTGADVRTIAGMRKAGGFGRATVTRRATRPHPKDAEIRALLHAGHGNTEIHRRTGADVSAVRRIRALLGVPAPVRTVPSLEEKWRKATKPVPGGHLEWTGSRVGESRTPVLFHQDTTHTAARVSFRLRTGRDPVGPVRSECGVLHCVAPEHVEDEPGRARLREQLRNVLGLGPRPDKCRRGHDQATHGRLAPDSTAYCEACHADRRTP